MTSTSRYWMAWLFGCGTSGGPFFTLVSEGCSNKLLEISWIHQFLKLSSERMIVHGVTAHTIMVRAILSGSWPLRVGREWPRAPDKLLVLDGTINLVHEDLKRSEVGFISVDLDAVSSGLMTRLEVFFGGTTRSLGE